MTLILINYFSSWVTLLRLKENQMCRKTSLLCHRERIKQNTPKKMWKVLPANENSHPLFELNAFPVYNVTPFDTSRIICQETRVTGSSCNFCEERNQVKFLAWDRAGFLPSLWNNAYLNQCQWTLIRTSQVLQSYPNADDNQSTIIFTKWEAEQKNQASS